MGHSACPENTEAVKVWAAALGSSDAISKWQKDWKDDARKPLYSLTKKKAGVSHTQYTFKFANKCSAVVLFSNSDGKTKLESGSCPETDKCMDHDAQVKKIIETSHVMKALLSTVKLSSSQHNCAHFVEMAKDFGFKCTDKLAALDVDAKLSDICCASCTGKQKPKETSPKTTTPKSKKTCGAPSYVGDGNCDDNNNNKGCEYDGGDCCAKSVKGGKVQETYCPKCECIDPAYQEQSTGKKCGLPSYKGDGNCDDENNHKGCAYDGGDCCPKTVPGGKVSEKYCTKCACVDPDNQGKNTCGVPDYKGDGNCDDENNNKGCAYDGGDCCPKTVAGGQVKKKYCSKCACVDPDNQGPAVPKCGLPDYKGDGNCDDVNNNKGCAYDGGDCCPETAQGGKVKTKYCTKCSCIDPKKSCGSPKYFGDGNCDDNNNNAGCSYDGGDCCAGTVEGGKVVTNYCKECKCIDPDA